jgi:hypothetical protein
MTDSRNSKLGNQKGTLLTFLVIGIHAAMPIAYVILWRNAFTHEDAAQRADLITFYTAAAIIAEHDARLLYDVNLQERLQAEFTEGKRSDETIFVFNYPPFTAIPFLGLEWASVETAYVLYSVVQLCLLLCAVWLLRPIWERWAKLEQLVLWLAAVSFWPAFRSIVLGNVSIPIVFLLISAWRLQRSGLDSACGCALAVAAGKPQMALPLLFGQFWARRWRVIFGSLGTIVALGTVSVLLVSTDGLRGFIEAMRVTATKSDQFGLHPEKMFNLRGAILVATGSDIVSRWSAWVGVAAMLGFTVWLWRPPRPYPALRIRSLDTKWAATVVAMLIGSPHLYQHDLTLLIPAAVIAYDQFRLSRGKQVVVAMLLGMNGLWIFGSDDWVPVAGVCTMVLLLVGILAAPRETIRDEDA